MNSRPPCVARLGVKAADTGEYRSRYIRLSNLVLHDCNELDHYRKLVIDSELLDDVKCCREERLVDCIAVCDDMIIGVEFTGEAFKSHNEVKEKLNSKKAGCGYSLKGKALVVLGISYPKALIPDYPDHKEYLRTYKSNVKELARMLCAKKIVEGIILLEVP